MPNDYCNLRDEALNELKSYMDTLDPSKGKKLAFWIKDYANFLRKEQSFCPNKLIKYKRGSIVKVHLGYRIGSEEGGLHYAIVLDKNNSIYSPTVTIIPLTSVKPGIDLTKLHFSNVPIGNEVYTLLMSNFNAEIRSARQHLYEIKELRNSLSTQSDLDLLSQKIDETDKQITYCEKMRKEADRMKQGSIALVGQITTISKIRIYDPKYNKDALSKVRVSSDTLDVLDEKIKELFGYSVPEGEKTEDF